MSEAGTIVAQPRTVVGKSSFKLAPEGLIPAVVYGAGFETRIISVDRHAFELYMSHHSAGSTILDLHFEGEKKPVSVMVRTMQHSPVKGIIIHIDFQVVRADEAIHTTIPLRVTGEAAINKAGAVLAVNLHEVEISALPGNLPEFIECDASELAVGDSMHVSDIVIPKGVTILADPDAIVCSVAAPREETEETTTEVVEPEVIGSKAKSEE